MEILISLVIGFALMEIYVWLDPLSKRLVRWAAAKLPEDRQEEFLAQWEGDLAAIPNSVFKFYFVLRDCVLPIGEIEQTMLREDLADMADGAEDIVSQWDNGIAEFLLLSNSTLLENRLIGAELIADLDEILERLQKYRTNESVSAINECIVLRPRLAEKISDFRVIIETGHTLLVRAASPLQDQLQCLAAAQLKIRKRLLDPRPIKDDDRRLLEALMVALKGVRAATEDFRHSPDRFRSATAELLPAVKETCAAFKFAIRAVTRTAPTLSIIAPPATKSTMDLTPKS